MTVIPRQRRAPPADFREQARALIRDAIAHYPGGRINALGLDYRDACEIHRLIQTARLDITWETT